MKHNATNKTLFHIDSITFTSGEGIDDIFVNEWNKDPDLPRQYACFKIFHRGIPQPAADATPEEREEYEKARHEEYSETDQLMTSGTLKRMYLVDGGYNKILTADEKKILDEYKTSRDFQDLPLNEQKEKIRELQREPNRRFAEYLFSDRKELRHYFYSQMDKRTPDSFQWFIDRMQRNYQMIIRDLKRIEAKPDRTEEQQQKDADLLRAYQADLNFTGRTREYAEIYLRIYLSLYLYSARHAPGKFGSDTLEEFNQAIEKKIESWELPQSDTQEPDPVPEAEEILSRDSIMTENSWLGLDKLSRATFSGDLEKAQKAIGEKPVPIGVERQNSERKVNVYMSMLPDEEQLQKEGVAIYNSLSAFDQRVYNAAFSLMKTEQKTARDNGARPNNVYSINEIGAAMGFNSLNKREKENISRSIRKMRLVPMSIDNHEEVEAGYNKTRFKYRGTLLPSEDMSLYVNGQLTEQAVHFLRIPMLSQYAESRKQISCIPKAVLQAPVSKTERNLTIEMYLESCIVQIKNGNRNNKILMKTLFKDCSITDKKAKQRTKDTIKTLLEHYKTVDFIKSYSMTKDAIIITPMKK